MNNIIWCHNHIYIAVPESQIYLNMSFPEKTTTLYEWTISDDPIVGGLLGFRLNNSGDCGICIPEAGFVRNSTFSATCTGWVANNQICYFEVRAVTADCGFESEPAIITSILTSKPQICT